MDPSTAFVGGVVIVLAHMAAIFMDIPPRGMIPMWIASLGMYLMAHGG